MKLTWLTLAALVLTAASLGIHTPARAADPAVTHHTTKIAGLNLFYREAGDPARPTIVLLHGFPSSSHMYRDLIPKLAVQYHVIAPDYPGFGLSDQPPVAEFAYTFDHLAAVTDEFLNSLKLAKYSIYIQDYGSPIGFRLFVKHPEKIQAIITQNGNAYEAGLSPAWQPFRAYWQDKSAENEAKLRGFLTLETTKFQYSAGFRNPAHVSPEAWAHDQRTLDQPGNAEIQLALFYDYQNNVKQYATWHAALRQHTPPVLAVWGKNDPFFLPAGAQAFTQDVPDAEIHLLDTGHFALEEDCGEIAEYILHFLGEKLGSPPSHETASSSARPESVVQQFYAAVTRGDGPGALALLNDQLEWNETARFPYYSGTWHTPEEIRTQLLLPLSRDWAEFAPAAQEYIATGDRVIALGTYRGTSKKNGIKINTAFAHAWTVRNGLITKFDMFLDPQEVIEAVK